MSDEKETEPRQKPFQFTIRHIIYLTVAVALLCALWNFLNGELLEYFSFILLSLHGLAFLYCTYSLPRVFRLHKRKTTFTVMAVILLSHIFFSIIVLVNIHNSIGWIIVIPFPSTIISAHLYFRLDGVIVFLCSAMFAHTYVYVVLLGLAYKSSRTLITSLVIGLFHLMAVSVGCYILSSAFA